MTRFLVFDTYALMEIIRGSPSYEKYKPSTVIINHFIFAELCYNVLKISKEKAEEAARIYKKHISIISSKQIFDAMVFRYRHKKRSLSMADCISYQQAQNRGVPFLTGDEQFRGMSGVEFVK